MSVPALQICAVDASPGHMHIRSGEKCSVCMYTPPPPPPDHNTGGSQAGRWSDCCNWHSVSAHETCVHMACDACLALVFSYLFERHLPAPLHCSPSVQHQVYAWTAPLAGGRGGSQGGQRVDTHA
eukprot:355827-Chlamydomonas_euryale.AAC.9